MVCYYHHSAQAVGICKNCQKGICEECAVDVGDGLACKNRCEGQVATINDVFERSKTQYHRLGSLYRRNAVWIATVGAVFVILGFLTILFFPGMGLINWVWIVLGLMFLASAAMNRAEGQKYSIPNKK